MRYILFTCLSIFTLSGFTQGENLIKQRYWNGTTNGSGITNSVGLQVSAKTVALANPLVRVDEATLSGAPPRFYFKRRFVLFFTIQNTSNNDVAVYDWAFKAVCPVDNMGRKFDATSLVPLVTPYIPNDIYIVLKPGEKKQFYSAETDFYWCLPQDKDDLLHEPQYFQALITCASVTGSATAAKPGQKPGGYQPPVTPPQTPNNNLDPQIEKLINEHNAFIQKRENEQAQTLKARILKIVNLVYPSLAGSVEAKLMVPKTVEEAVAPAAPVESGMLSFNGSTMEADGDCIDATASLTSSDEAYMLILNNIGGAGSYSVSPNFYTNGCTSCLAVQFQDIQNAQTYVAVSGSVNRTAQGIMVDVVVKELLSLIEGGGSGYRVTGKIICE